MYEIKVVLQQLGPLMGNSVGVRSEGASEIESTMGEFIKDNVQATCALTSCGAFFGVDDGKSEILTSALGLILSGLTAAVKTWQYDSHVFPDDVQLEPVLEELMATIKSKEIPSAPDVINSQPEDVILSPEIEEALRRAMGKIGDTDIVEGSGDKEG